MAIQDLTASLDLKQNLNIYATCKQFDDLILELNIYDNSLQADLSNYDVRLKAFKADKVPLIQQHIGITINSNIVNIEADEQLTTTSGKTIVELQFINKTTGKKKAAFNLVLIVVPSILEVNSTISKSTYTLLEELENKLDQASDFFENIDNAINANNELKDTITDSENAKTNLDGSISTGNTSKIALDTSNTNATNTKNVLDALKTSADNTKNALNTVNQTGQTLLNSLESFENQHADVSDISNKLASVNADLSEKTSLTDEQLLKGVLYSASSKVENFNINTDMIYYQAVIENPIDTKYTNMPIALKINFKQGECPTVKHILIKDSNGNVLPFQWEGDVHPNYLISENLATYSDGSLKSGIIWLMGNLDINEKKVITIEIHSVEQSNIYTPLITHTVNSTNPSSLKDDFTTSNNIFIEFDSSGANYVLKKYLVNGTEMNHNTTQVVMPFMKNTDNTTDINLTDITKFTATNSISGDGIAFIDYTVVATYPAVTGLTITTKYRIFANGMVDIDCRLRASNGTNARGVQGFGLKVKLANTARTTAQITDGGFTDFTTDGTLGAIYKIIHTNLDTDLIDPTIQYNDRIADSSYTGDNGYIGTSVFWDSISDKTLPVNSLFYIKAYIAPYIATTIPTNINQITNQLSVHATKSNLFDLKQKYLALCKKFADRTHNSSGLSSIFPGLIQFEKFAYDKVNNIIKEYENQVSITDYISALQNTYNGATASGFQTIWQGGRGVEFIGRDTAPIMYFRNQCNLINKDVSYDTLTSIIHELADFYVWLETFSGGEGKIMLQSYSTDVMNSEATAMRALYNSLKIEPNTTRQSCYDRIKNRFENTVEYETSLPYFNGKSIVLESIFHYHCFSLFEYLNAVDTPNFNITSFINQCVTASGKLFELGFTYTPIRIGLVHSSLYASYIMYKHGTISSLETACKLVENILSKCYPNGGHQFPLDGWKNVNGSSMDLLIETQVAYEALMEIIFVS